MGQRIEFELHPVEGGVAPPGLTLRDIFCAFFRHKGKALLFFLATVAAVMAFMSLAKKTYQSEGKLFVRLGRENATLDPTATLGQGPTVVTPVSRENEINSVAELIRNRVLIEQVVDTVGPPAILAPLSESDTAAAASDRPWPSWPPVADWLRQINIFPAVSDRDKAIDKLSKKLRVEPVPRSNVVLVTYNGYSPETAQAVVKNLVDLYLDRHVQWNRPHGAHEFLAEQTARLKASLAHSEAEFRDLLNEKCIVSPDGLRETLVKDLSQVETGLRDATASAVASEAQVQDLSGAIAKLPKLQMTGETTGFGDYGTDLMREQLYTLQLKEQELLAKYTDQYPELRHVRAQAVAAKEAIRHETPTRSQVTTAPDRTYEETQISLIREKSVLSSWKAKVATLNVQVADLRRDMKAFNDADFRMRKLRREIELLDAKYRKYSENLEQARIDQALEVQRMSNISVAQPATYEAEPSFPRPLPTIAIGLGVGLFGAVGIALMAGYRAPPPVKVEESQEQREPPARAPAPHLLRKAR